jgi:hypothetical protein
MFEEVKAALQNLVNGVELNNAKMTTVQNYPTWLTNAMLIQHCLY